jgi:hypothetical protein
MKLALTLCAGLLILSHSSLAADPVMAPMPAGKPAGIHTAAEIDTRTWLIIGGAAAIGIIIGVAASGDDNNSITPITSSPSTTS